MFRSESPQYIDCHPRLNIQAEHLTLLWYTKLLWSNESLFNQSINQSNLFGTRNQAHYRLSRQENAFVVIFRSMPLLVFDLIVYGGLYISDNQRVSKVMNPIFMNSS